MAYPTISAPYGLKPINLIGGQVFAGSTRNLQIQYGFNTNIFYGDVVGISRGFITRSTVTTGAGATTGSVGTIGVFLGCSYTNPITKQKQFAQYWPAGTLAGDAVAIVTDDPDTLFKVAAVTAAAGTTIGSVARSMIGLNVNGSDGAGSTATGNSGIAIGTSAGQDTQGAAAIAIGQAAGLYYQGERSIAIGKLSGNTNQGEQAIAIGFQAGLQYQGSGAVSIGSYTNGGDGNLTQGINAVSIGANAGAGYININPIEGAIKALQLFLSQYSKWLMEFNPKVNRCKE
jgi:hypothetical protein